MAGISQEGKHNNLTTDALRYDTLVLAIAARDEQDTAIYSFKSFVILDNQPYGSWVISLEASGSVVAEAVNCSGGTEVQTRCKGLETRECSAESRAYQNDLTHPHTHWEPR
jgi:hypothetical protein